MKPVSTFLAIGVIFGLHFASAEMTKRWFFNRYE